MKTLKSAILTSIMLFAAVYTHAQNTPIDDLIKRYGSQEGFTSVSMSQQMLQSIFEPVPISEGGGSKRFFSINVPEAYRSITIPKAEKSVVLYADLRNLLIASRYEQHMESNKGNSDI